MGDDDLTLTPVYRFEWEDGTVRRTDDEDALNDEWTPDAVERLAESARADDECEVELIGMGT